MGLFDFFKKKPDNKPERLAQTEGPYHDSATNMIYELLFCDKPELFERDGTPNDPYPWGILCNPACSADDLRKVAEDRSLDSRVRAVAWNKVVFLGGQIDEQRKELLGVIVEIGTDNGLDVLAAFADGSVRYINHSGGLLVWEKLDDPTSRELINDLFTASITIVGVIGRGKYARRKYPSKGNARISFVSAAGFSFGEGEIGVLFSDPLAGPSLTRATKLLQYITQAVE
jgi:hypothetical protein